MSTSWRVRLSHQAEQDGFDVLQWTHQHVGPGQADQYAEPIASAVDALTLGPSALGSKARDDVAPGLRTLHIAGPGLHARPLILFRVTREPVLEVLRVLHDGMDLARHLPANDPSL